MKADIKELGGTLDELMRRILTPRMYRKSLRDLTEMALEESKGSTEQCRYITELRDLLVSSICAVITEHAVDCSTPALCLPHIFQHFTRDLDLEVKERLQRYKDEVPTVNFGSLLSETINEKVAREIQEEIDLC